MDRVAVGDVELAYTDVGQGSETVVLSHSFLVDSRQFDRQVEALADRYRVIAFDHRDHGSSSRCSDSYTLDDLLNDAMGLIDKVNAAPCHFVGLSAGGFVGMRIAYRHPEVLRTLVLMDTDARAERFRMHAKNKSLLAALRLVGIRPLLGTAMKTMFAKSFLVDAQRAEEVAVWRSRIAANDPDALVRFGNAIFDRDDVLDALRGLDLPTLVVVGEQDRALPPHLSEAIAAAVPGAELRTIRDAGHLCTIEAPYEVNEVLASFLSARGSS